MQRHVQRCLRPGQCGHSRGARRPSRHEMLWGFTATDDGRGWPCGPFAGATTVSGRSATGELWPFAFSCTATR